MEIRYDQRLDQYRGAKGRIVPRREVMRLLDEEMLRQQTRFRGHALNFTAGNIDLAEFEQRMAHDIKLSHIRMTAFAAGGVKELDNQYYGIIGRLLRRQYEYLDGFAQDIEDGKLDAKAIVRRAALYGDAAKTSFYSSEKAVKVRQKFNQAKRTLDSQAQHCNDCIRYASLGWRNIEDVVVPGVRCQCGQHCKCSISYRRYNP